MKRVISFVLALLATPVFAADWKPADVSISSRWAADVRPDRVLPEYPRPQMAREAWANLNGLWDYAVTAKDADRPVQFEGKILVPFPIESSLSGVKRELTPKDRIWYRRTFATALEGGKRLLLHFGAVDHDAVVWLNGRQLGEHRGGYDAFSFDITDALKPGADNELVVAVVDTTGGNGEPKGKQHLGAIRNPGGIMYTPCSGIWQTVWLEPVPAVRVKELKITPDVDGGKVQVVVECEGATAQTRVQVNVEDPTTRKREGQVTEVKVLAGQQGRPGEAIELPVQDAKLWTPDQPFLYDLDVRVMEGDTVVDTVTSYFGMRKIALGKDEKGVTRILLNGKFVFQSGPLDQGFWPDGIYTAPTDEALRYDIEITRKLGFNMARKHVKIEPERWYYWCDKLGLLVWQDMPSGGAGKAYVPPKEAAEKKDAKPAKGDKKPRTRRNAEHDGVPASPEKAEQFEKELNAMVQQHRNHPSIIMWVVFNEGWGQYDTARLVGWVKSLDPTRLVNNASGWTDRHVGDVSDMHNYPGPGCPACEPDRAAVLGEFGGLGLPVPGHTWVDKSWGYRGMDSQKALTRKYLELWQKAQQLRDEAGLCAAVYTQTTDCETECNGLLTYDRKVVKVDLEQVAAGVGRGEFPAAPKYEPIIATAEQGPALWRYTTAKPPVDWFKPGFDASSWKEAPGGFGKQGTPNVNPRTEWRTDDIWLRREITLPDLAGRDVALRFYHDDDAEVYINGVLVGKYHGFNVDYEVVELPPAAVAALKAGKNIVAVHCHQNYGGQYVDLGLGVLKMSK